MSKVYNIKIKESLKLRESLIKKLRKFNLKKIQLIILISYVIALISYFSLKNIIFKIPLGVSNFFSIFFPLIILISVGFLYIYVIFKNKKIGRKKKFLFFVLLGIYLTFISIVCFGMMYRQCNMLGKGGLYYFIEDSYVSGFDYYYFSAITFFSLGYGDLAPIGFYPKIITILEAFMGHIILGVMVIAVLGEILKDIGNIKIKKS